jgi:undecaprenyl-diphosphatase
MLQAIDEGFALFLNAYAAKSLVFDHAVDAIVTLPSLKVLPIVACLVGLWFSPENGAARRATIVKGIVAAFVGLVLSRLIQNLSSFRPRPMHTEHLAFVLPLGISPERMHEWSSFPSDTTALAFALAATVWCLSRPLGWACFVWSAVIVGLPRIYTGYHYPSDIVGGAILGIAVTWACTRLIPDRRVDDAMLSVEKRQPVLFYGLSFIIMYQIATFFEDIRFLAKEAGKVIARLF